MELDVASDQDFFRETTRNLLDGTLGVAEPLDMREPSP
jgi:hypothetical protein